MKIFISWSGNKSRAVALLLEDWIKCVIQAADPWVSTNIETGALWYSEINEQLASVSIGIICITAENKERPWILFEAGALAKGLQANRVCTLLVDLKNEDIEQPLAQFNHTYPDKEGICRLVNTINAHLGERKLNQGTLDKVFEKNWPDFSEQFKVISELPVAAKAKQPKRESDDILVELLNTVRGLDKRLQNMENITSFSPPEFSSVRVVATKPGIDSLTREAIRRWNRSGMDKNTILKLLEEKGITVTTPILDMLDRLYA